jgi:PhnB protein
MADVKPIPDNLPQLVPYLSVDDADAAIRFYVDVLGFTERMRMPGPDGKIGHAELDLGASMIMLADEFDANPSPKTTGGTPVGLMVYLEDVDAVFAKALAAGATQIEAVEDKFYGDRSGMFEDPFGHRWNVSTHIEDVSDEEIGKRMAAMTEQPG